jgi:hypothetical protein
MVGVAAGIRDAVAVKVDVLCTYPHYARHLRPIFEALPIAIKGQWFGPTDDPHGDGIIVVAAYRDLRRVRRRYRKTVLVEHGAGQAYVSSSEHPAYHGSDKRHPYDLLLAPGLHVVDPAAARAVSVGCLPLDYRHPNRINRIDRPDPVIGLSFHWDGSGIAPEAGTALWEYLPHLESLAEQFHLLGHSHPKIWDEARTLYEKAGIEAVEHFDDLLNRCELYVCDNSSTMFEAATIMPVVVLNSWRYRRHVTHGTRFWEYANVGPQCDDPADLPALLERFIADRGRWPDRERIVAECYGACDGNAVERAVSAILGLL